MNRKADPSACTHCHTCRQNCAFLDKYGMDIGDTDKLKELAYHCFLCGKCTEVCPEGIDGRDYILNLRRQAVESNGGKVPGKGYGILLKEKSDYIYKNYKHAKISNSGKEVSQKKSLLFPGCNFPSFYPKTTKYLSSLMEEYGIGTIYDCCGKPIAELGLEKEEEKIINRLNREMEKRGIEQLIMVCPNCYDFLKPRLQVEVVDIYEKLAELGIKPKFAKEKLAELGVEPKYAEGKLAETTLGLESLGKRVFLPCPDREKGEILNRIQQYLDQSFQPIEGVQCCGLGGCAAAKEGEMAAQFANAVKAEMDKDKNAQILYCYCATCSGNLSKNGCGDVRHLLVKILGTGEKPDTKKSMINRMKTKFI